MMDEVDSEMTEKLDESGAWSTLVTRVVIEQQTGSLGTRATGGAGRHY
jgi:hypothetical protein